MELEIRDADFWDINFRPSEPKSVSGKLWDNII